MENTAINFVKDNLGLIIQLSIHTLILFVGIKFINKISANFKKKISTDSNINNKLHLLFVVTRLIKILFAILILASFLQINGYSLTSLMTGLGITGLAIGFAAKESLSCVLGSFSIMLDNIYKIGDYVEINGYTGIVESINFHSTKLRTANNSLITIPNNIPADSIVENKSNAKYFKMVENFDIEYSTPEEKIKLAMNIIKEYCENNSKFQKGTKVLISELGENAITLKLMANTKTYDVLSFAELKSALFEHVIHEFNTNNISFAFPSKTVYLRNEN